MPFSHDRDGALRPSLPPMSATGWQHFPPAIFPDACLQCTSGRWALSSTDSLLNHTWTGMHANIPSPTERKSGRQACCHLSCAAMMTFHGCLPSHHHLMCVASWGYPVLKAPSSVQLHRHHSSSLRLHVPFSCHPGPAGVRPCRSPPAPSASPLSGHEHLACRHLRDGHHAGHAQASAPPCGGRASTGQATRRNTPKIPLPAPHGSPYGPRCPVANLPLACRPEDCPQTGKKPPSRTGKRAHHQAGCAGASTATFCRRNGSSR